MTLRSAFYFRCLELLSRGPVYRWGGRRDDGVDCGGFVELALFKASEGKLDLRHLNTDGLWNLAMPVLVDEAQVGDLAFYSAHPTPADPVSHVMVYAGEGQCFGMAWGGPADVDPAISRGLGHVVKVMPINYRPDFVGFRRIPLDT